MEIVDPADRGDVLATYYADASKVNNSNHVVCGFV